MRKHSTWLAALALAGAAYAQGPVQVRRAAIGRSQGTSGKCTVEVRVDIAAEVDIYGNSARLRTIAGQPATFSRFECSDPLPYRMTDFRFQGIDGRGSQQLFKDPRGNNSMAVIHIEDPDSGAEGYTFDIEWSGASGGAPVDAFARGGGPPPPPPPAAPVRPDRPERPPIRISAERAMDLCRAEVHSRGARDYGLRDIDITSIGIENSRGRANWITGYFTEGGFNFRDSEYRFNCSVDWGSGRIGTIEFLRADGGPLRPGRRGR